MNAKHKSMFFSVFLGIFLSSASLGLSLPAPAAGAQTRESRNITGVWRGTCEMRSGTILFSPLFTLKLSQVNDVVTGEGEFSYGGTGEQGVIRFVINGTVNGSAITLRTTDYQLIKRYTGRKAEARFFETCSQFSFSLTLQTGRVDQAFFSSYAATENPQPTDLVGDLLFGRVRSQDGSCVATTAFGLIRQSQVIVIMFGGFFDADKGFIPGNKFMQNGVVLRYLRELRELQAEKRVYQTVQYFEHDHHGTARNFVLEQLRSSPQAKLALVGHSLGGNATFALAEKLQQELPQVRIDLVITLDPVTQHQVNPRPGGRPARGRPPLSWVAKVPPRPANVNEWINVYVDVSNHFTSAKFGGTQWGKQPAATVNSFWHGKHKDAEQMFNQTIGGTCPADKLKALSGFATASRPLLIQKINLLMQATGAASEKVSNIRSGGTGTEKQPAASAPASRNSVTYKVASRLLTNLTVRKGEKIQINADGIMRLGTFAGSSSPEGIDGFGLYSYFPAAPHGALFVRVTQNGRENWILCGSECSFTAPGSGRVELLVNDKDTDNNQGFYSVSVRRQP